MRIIEDIIYDERHATPLALDLYLPDAPASAVVLHAHGGGFFKGSRKGDVVTQFAQRLTYHGLAMAAVSYRLATPPKALDKATRFVIKENRRRSREVGVNIANRLMGSACEAARQDLSSALNFLNIHHSEFYFKSQKQGIIGISSGGIAGLALAFPSENLPALTRPDAVIALGAAILHPWALSPDGPPSLMIHSHYDRVIDPSNAGLAARSAAATNAPLSVFTCERAGHNAPIQALLRDDAPSGTPFWSAMLETFQRASLLIP